LSAEQSIAVIGAGAIGGAMAAALGDAGHQVELCVRTPFHRLSRQLDGQTCEYPHPVHTHPDGLAPADWVLLCTKAHQIEGAAPWLHRLIGPQTRVGVMQNGVGHADRVAAYVTAERVAPCVILLPVRVDAPGAVVQARSGTVRVPESEVGRELAGLFADQSAITFEPTADFASALWSKMVLNAVGGAICALAVKPLGAMAAPEVHDLAIGLIEEVMAVGRAEGASFADDFAEQTIEYFRGPIGEHWTSMAVDRREGRLMEWDARNAVVGRIGRRHGIETPLNDALTALLSLVDAPVR
jgi:2-dehydropantoate 2-reductase